LDYYYYFGIIIIIGKYISGIREKVFIFGKGFYVKTEKLQRRGKGQRAVEQRLENGKA
jgi:hypothetical protein